MLEGHVEVQVPDELGNTRIELMGSLWNPPDVRSHDMFCKCQCGDDVVNKVGEHEVKDIKKVVLDCVELHGPAHHRREGLCQNVRWHELQRWQMLGAKFE